MDLKTIILVLSLSVALSFEEKVKVSVYYESLCPDSISFIKSQLLPAYKKLHSIMKVDLVPYGKATQNLVNGTWQFDCQHGKNECFGNKVQACALHQDYPEETEVAYIGCIMSQRNPALAGESRLRSNRLHKTRIYRKCANQVSGVTWPNINKCVFDTKGDEYLAAYGDRTHAVNPQISFVPTVIFNDQYDQNLMWDALRNLQSVICKISKDTSVCSSQKTKDN